MSSLTGEVSFMSFSIVFSICFQVISVLLSVLFSCTSYVAYFTLYDKTATYLKIEAVVKQSCHTELSCNYF